MTLKSNTIFAFWCILLSFPLLATGQEYITGLTQNPLLLKNKSHETQLKSSTALKLPFVEDFSKGTGYPDANMWQDKQAFINNTYPIFPPSIGVATLDAIDEHGKIYQHASRESFPADTLTSNLIRLDSNFTLHRPMRVADSIYFSFYYQPGGGCRVSPAVEWERIGDAPEFDDELILEFGYATGNMIFTGFEYGEYILGDEEHYIAGDSIENPFMPGCFYVFESTAYPGEIVMIPADSIFGPEYIWNRVWHSNGCSLDSWLTENPLQYFKQVLIPITDEQYFRNNFQFRFRNYASLDLDSWSSNNIVGWTSNCDQWHIDYIRLDVDRSQNDFYPNDVAFVSPTTSALQLYQSMPWNQYRSSDMASHFQNDLSNLSASTKNTAYHYSVRKNGANVYTSLENNENAHPFHTNGLHDYSYHANPAIDFMYEYDNQDSATFIITHIFRMEGANDELKENDTCVFEQKFYNYYAYDDGTAEAGYCLLSSEGNPESSVAVQFKLAQPDTLRCVRMWFNQTLNDENVDYFTLKVWDDIDGKPGEEIYSLPAQLPQFATDFLDFVNYYPEEPIPVSGTFYIGFTQTHNTQLNLGFDQNNDARGHFFYKTSNDWRESFYKGAPMIRPVLGAAYDHSGVQTRKVSDIRIYPNPTEDKVFVDFDDMEILQYQLLDICGRILENKTLSQPYIQLGEYVPGMYILKIYKDKKLLSTEKIIKR